MTRRLGATVTEYTLVISVVVVALLVAAYVFIPGFTSGVNELGADVEDILAGDNANLSGVNHGAMPVGACPYVFDSRTGRWHDPNANYLMVSFADAEAANCSN